MLIRVLIADDHAIVRGGAGSANLVAALRAAARLPTTPAHQNLLV